MKILLLSPVPIPTHPPIAGNLTRSEGRVDFKKSWMMDARRCLRDLKNVEKNESA